jgi:tryptophan 2,3-dioxygenase
MTWNGSGRRSDGRELTYSEYINVPALLRAQRLPEEVPRGRSRDEWPLRPTVRDGDHERPWAEGDRWPTEWPHEELLFIVTHQTFELWFRQILHDLDDVMARVTETLAKHGAALPRSTIMQRDPADAPPFRQVASRYPETNRVIETLLSTNEWERRWAQELHEPGALPRRTDPAVQAFELAWFDAATLDLFARRIARAAMILRHATGAFDILATMPPEEFLTFRSRLNPASGFGSTQFREIEILVGLGDMHRRKLESRGDLSFHRHMPADEVRRIQERLAAATLRDLVYAILNARDVRGDDAAFAARADHVMSGNLKSLHDDFALSSAQFSGASDVENHVHARWRVVDELMTHAENLTLVDLYTRHDTPPSLRELLERCLELDDAIRAWRQSHIPMVERMIGARPGTGGGGITYLHTTLRMSRAFPSLWEFRSILTQPR